MDGEALVYVDLEGRAKLVGQLWGKPFPSRRENYCRVFLNRRRHEKSMQFVRGSEGLASRLRRILEARRETETPQVMPLRRQRDNLEGPAAIPQSPAQLSLVLL